MQSDFDMSAEFEAAFSKRVREQRQAYGLTQRALSEALAERGLKLDPSAITRLERAAEKGETKRGIRLGEAVVIATELDIDLSAMASDFDVPETRFRELTFEAERRVEHLLDASIGVADILSLIADLIDSRPEVLDNQSVKSSDEYFARILRLAEDPDNESTKASLIRSARHRAAIKKVLAALSRRVVVAPNEHA